MPDHKCTSCRYAGLVGGQEPCHSCFDGRVPFQHWEAKADPVAPAPETPEERALLKERPAEPAGHTDTQRLDWVMALLDDSGPTNRKLLALAAGLVVGKAGRDLIDYAMEGCR